MRDAEKRCAKCNVVRKGEKACDDMEDRQDRHISLAKIFVYDTYDTSVTKMKIWRQTNLYLLCGVMCVMPGDW
jgi:hypothetical protein